MAIPVFTWVKTVNERHQSIIFFFTVTNEAILILHQFSSKMLDSTTTTTSPRVVGTLTETAWVPDDRVPG